MAGGTIVLLGLDMKRGEKLFGTHCASGMHGGKIFVRGTFPKENISYEYRHGKNVITDINLAVTHTVAHSVTGVTVNNNFAAAHCIADCVLTISENNN